MIKKYFKQPQKQHIMINLYAFRTEQEAKENVCRLQSDSKKQKLKDQLFHEVYLPFVCKEKENEWFGFVDTSGFTAATRMDSLNSLAEKLHEMISFKKSLYHLEEIPHLYTFRDNVKKPQLVIGRYPGLAPKYGKNLRYLTEQEMEEFQQAYLGRSKSNQKTDS